MMQFTLSNVWAMDSALAIQLERWHVFKGKNTGVGSEEGYFANHCPHCGVLQEVIFLHSEPGDVFFGLSARGAGPMEFTRCGRIQVSGDCSFWV